MRSAADTRPMPKQHTEKNPDTGKRARIAKHAAYLLAMAGAALLCYALLMRDIRVTLWPHMQFFHLVYGMDFVFVPGTGYVAAAAGLAITGDCMGAKLFVGMVLLLVLGFAPRGAGGAGLAGFTVKAFLGALAGAITVSILRIAASIPFCARPDAQLIHNIISLAAYFGSMAALFLWMQRRQAEPGGKEEKPT